MLVDKIKGIIVKVVVGFTIIFFAPWVSFASCDKENICKMTKKMNPFAILDECLILLRS